MRRQTRRSSGAAIRSSTLAHPLPVHVQNRYIYVDTQYLSLLSSCCFARYLLGGGKQRPSQEGKGGKGERDADSKAEGIKKVLADGCRRAKQFPEACVMGAVKTCMKQAFPFEKDLDGWYEVLHQCIHI